MLCTNAVYSDILICIDVHMCFSRRENKYMISALRFPFFLEHIEMQ